MIKIKEFGTTGNGCAVHSYLLENSKGMRVRVLDLGATLQAVEIPNGDGVLDVALGYDDVAGYEVNAPWFGAVVGRNCNRIADGAFSIDGVEYTLGLNEEHVIDGHRYWNNLHSEPGGYNKRMYEATTLTVADMNFGEAGAKSGDAVIFSMTSPDGDQGFPGELKFSVTYCLTDDNELIINYEGESDRKTVVNFTNHSYWNLNGESAGSIMDHTLKLNALYFTPVDECLIPTGRLGEVEGTVLDFRAPAKLSDKIAEFTDGHELGAAASAAMKQFGICGGYDMNFVIDGEGFREAAEITGDQTGIKMTVLTDRPGIQFYSGNFIGEEHGKGGSIYRNREGLALETQFYPNAANLANSEDAVPGIQETCEHCIIDAGERFSTTTIYRFE